MTILARNRFLLKSIAVSPSRPLRCRLPAVQVSSNAREQASPTSPLPGGVMPTDHSSSPFEELDLVELWRGLGRTRLRQHVNPLRAEYQEPFKPIDWATRFKDPTLPLIIDLGCGPGRFLMLFNKRNAEARGENDTPKCYNYLGVEIRKALVDRANEWVLRLGYNNNIHYVYSNATLSLQVMLENYPGKVESVYIQFPDPHFKKRHHKRRIFQPELVRAIINLLKPGGLLFLQSDVEDVSIAMRNMFEMYAFKDLELAQQHSGLVSDVFFSSQRGALSEDVTLSTQQQHESTSTDEVEENDSETREELNKLNLTDTADYDSMHSKWEAGGWLRKNPLGTPTEREHYVEQQGLPVYRILLSRKG